MCKTWPWKSTALDAFLLFGWNQTTSRRAGGAIQSWTLSTDRTAIYPSRITEEGGACRKFYQTDCNCCIQIGDNGKVVADKAKNIGKIAHVLVQTMFLFKTIIGIAVVILTNVCLFPASYPS